MGWCGGGRGEKVEGRGIVRWEDEMRRKGEGGEGRE